MPHCSYTKSTDGIIELITDLKASLADGRIIMHVTTVKDEEKMFTLLAKEQTTSNSEAEPRFKYTQKLHPVTRQFLEDARNMVPIK